MAPGNLGNRFMIGGMLEFSVSRMNTVPIPSGDEPGR